eukprot:TRINITY_DN12064_c0_g1_i1.p2 TRINITY_DN12064_c0_g1~~TRINITY_DN12064_c0_g1_i1.p2  ORF type:complete len:140 (-),score=9.47 TRINITY_DN12064_c0_g1_i1:82-501(-)
MEGILANSKQLLTRSLSGVSNGTRCLNAQRISLSSNGSFFSRNFHASSFLCGAPQSKPSLATRRTRWHTQRLKPVQNYRICSGCQNPILPHNICAKCNLDETRRKLPRVWEMQQKVEAQLKTTNSGTSTNTSSTTETKK